MALKVVCSTGPLRAVTKRPKISSKNPSQSKRAILEVAEKLNGRLAMQGVTWGTINQFVLHEGGVRTQIQDPHNMMTAAAVTALVALGTSVTQNDEHKSYFAWTPEAETLNGRAAMCAMVLAGLLNL
jgi:hypothetical protein